MSRETENIERLMNGKGVEFRSFTVANAEMQKTDDGTEELWLEGAACVFGKETVLCGTKDFECRERVQRGAFDNADMSDVIFNYNHGGRVYARTRNNSLSLEIREDGLYVRIRLMKNDEGHAQLYRDISSGLIDKMSFAFTVDEAAYEYTERDGAPVVELRTITKIGKLYDVSAVDIPAYDETSISARRAFDAEREKRGAESIGRAKNKLKLKIKLEGIE